MEEGRENVCHGSVKTHRPVLSDENAMQDKRGSGVERAAQGDERSEAESRTEAALEELIAQGPGD